MFSTRVLRMMVAYLLPTPSSPLLDLLLQFVCGDSASSLLLPVLISRVNCNSSTVSIVTMHLFNELLKSQHPSVFAALLPVPEAQEPVPQSCYLYTFSILFQDPLPCASQLGVSQSSVTLPQSGATLSQSGVTLPQSGATLSQSGVTLPQSGATPSQSSTVDASQTVTTPTQQPTSTPPQRTITITPSQSSTTSPSTISKYMSDMEFEVASVHSCRPPQHDCQQQGHDAFLTQLLARIRMFLRQSMEVNLEVTRLLTTLSIVAPTPLFVELFLSRSPFSFVRELDAVGTWVESEV